MNRQADFSKNKKIAHLLGHYINDTGRNMVRTLQQNFRKAGYGVTAEQWFVLVWLFDKDGRTQQELCDLTYKDKPSITRILNNLEKTKLIIRTEHPADGRSKIIYLTEKCKEIERPLLEIADQTQLAAIKGLSKMEIAECKRMLGIITNNLL